MYRVRLDNGAEQGPLSLEAVRAGLRSGQFTLATPARSENSSEWKPLGEFSEFSPIRPPVVPGIPASPFSGPTPPPLRKPTQLNRFALVSLLLGAVGFFVFTAIAGLVTGVIALRQMRREPGRYHGRVLARIGIGLSVVMLGVWLFFVLVIVPQFQRPGFPPQGQPMRTHGSRDCSRVISQLGLAVRQYASDHGDVLPPAGTWCDGVREYVPSMSVYLCPNAPAERRSSFALNVRVAGKNLEQVHPQAVLLFESTQGWNASGGAELAKSSTANSGSLVVYFASGKVENVSAGQVGSLRWDP